MYICKNKKIKKLFFDSLIPVGAGVGAAVGVGVGLFVGL